MDTLHFQYCQKIVVFSDDKKSVLLCKRKGEQDYDGVFSFIGGKMETTDPSIIEGLRREKNEEIGDQCRIQVYPEFSTNLLFKKKDGSSMILPHYTAIFQSGEIILNDEYSEYQWVLLTDLKTFEPKIESIPETVSQVLRILACCDNEKSVLI